MGLAVDYATQDNLFTPSNSGTALAFNDRSYTNFIPQERPLAFNDRSYTNFSPQERPLAFNDRSYTEFIPQERPLAFNDRSYTEFSPVSNQGSSDVGLGFNDRSYTEFEPTQSSDSFNYTSPDRSYASYNAPSSSFGGYSPRVNHSGSSFGGIGASVGMLAGGPVGAAVGGVAGGAVDMYMSYLESEERKKAERRRLEEARRQQIAARRREDADRKFNMRRYEDELGFRESQEGRAQEGFDFDMKNKRAEMLRRSFINSINDNAGIRDIFAKRGVI